MPVDLSADPDHDRLISSVLALEAIVGFLLRRAATDPKEAADLRRGLEAAATVLEQHRVLTFSPAEQPAYGRLVAAEIRRISEASLLQPLS